MRKLTRTEANFENLLEAALLVEGHCSHAKERGCCCRDCDECEKNYMMEYGEEEEDDRPTLEELIDELGDKPNTNVPHEYEGEDPYEEYDEEAEDPKFDSINAALELVSRMPKGNYLSLNPDQRRMAAASGKIAKGVESVANKFAKDAAAMSST